MLIGYARVSTWDQNPQLQIDALVKAGVDPDNIYQEHISGVKKNRPQLAAALQYLREGDTLVVWKLDRLGRSLQNLLEIMAELNERKIGFHSLGDSIDTTTSMGKFMFQVLGAVAEFERNLISERTKAGLEAARNKHGHTGGRTPALDDEECQEAKRLMDETKFSGTKIAGMFKISRSALYRNVDRWTAEQAAKVTAE